MTAWTRLAVMGVATLGLAGCGGDGPEGPSAGPTPMALTVELRVALERGLQDEYRAETIYQGVITDLGQLLPFVNVLTAEQRHSASIAALFTRRGLVAPPNRWTVANVPHFTTVPAACAAAVTAERENIAIYDELLRLDLPTDVRQVFTNNRSGSLDNHLPAFARCS